MPKSKRDKKISLTNTKKKGLQFKQQLVQEVRECVDKYERIFVFSVENMRNGKLKDLRDDWKKDSRFLFGKCKVMQLGLGKSKEDEPHENLHRLSKQLIGQCGLLFTNRPKQEVLDFFETFTAPDYARSGFVATEEVVLPEGPLPEFAHSLEPHLRQLGMPTSLQKGIITLVKDYTVCKKGSVLTPDQARILKLIGMQMAEFRVTLKCMWDKNRGKIKKFKNKSSKSRNGTEDNFSLRIEADDEMDENEEGNAEVDVEMDEEPGDEND
ncbi:mRNA turnover protein 4-like protein [Frankliniella fusca]|uniref:Ribosome assembly factor mrt4 n=1 Tax=Frankliniella fusca TaxID=407009 RepID=A0AAE1LKQ0_9NEOP|nr:mRNA turnover protein 4-like protein [Frankliniella fusca]